MKDKKWRIIFDYDDTLIRHDTKKELMYMAEYLGLSYNDEFHRQFSSFYTEMGKWLPRGKITRRKIESCIFNSIPLIWQNGMGLFEFFEAEKYKEEKLNLVIEGTEEVLEYLKQRGYYLCILTNGFQAEQANSLKLQGLSDYFERVYTWDDYYAKPDKRAFYRALANTQPEENVMIGNNILHDIIPAKEIGIYTFGIHLKDESKKLAMPDKELQSLIELKQYL